MNETPSSPSITSKRSHSDLDKSEIPKKIPKLLSDASASTSSIGDNELRQRHVEKGLLRPLNNFSVVLRFHTSPVWILALDPQYIDFIYMPDHSSWSDFQRALSHDFNNSVLIKALLQLTPAKFIFGPVPSSAHSYLNLFSGPLSYLHFLYDPLSTSPTIFLVQGHSQLRKLPPSALSLSRLTHKSVGGVTSFTILCSTQNLPAFTPELTSLRRRLGSIIDHSIRQATVVTFPCLLPHLTLSQFLLVSHLDTNILVPSNFSASGFGIRQLHTHELLITFGFPLSYHHITIAPSDLLSVIPL